MNQVLKYYHKNYLKIFDSIKDSKWRVWKIIDYDDRMIQSKFPIAQAEDLWKFIKQAEKPKALYVSVSTFLNSHLNHGAFYRQNFKLNDGTYMFPREGYIISDCIMLSTDLFIDLDSEEDLTIAQEDGRKIIRHMDDKPEYKLNMLQFSATKGIHLGYEFLDKPHINDPIKRIEHYKAVKGKLAKELLKLGLKTIDRHHIGIIKNNFCVFAAPHSLKSNGNVVTPLNFKDFMHKDIYDTADVLTTVGSEFFRNRVPENDATIVRLLQEAGTILLGKTNMNEFAAGVSGKNSFFGDTHNPWDLERSAGGSSSGTAAAIAAGLCLGGTGTDTGGSIRIPASWCGLVGMRPTYGPG